MGHIPRTAVNFADKLQAKCVSLTMYISSSIDSNLIPKFLLNIATFFDFFFFLYHSIFTTFTYSGLYLGSDEFHT